jgi:flagellar motor switch protein FliG
MNNANKEPESYIKLSGAQKAAIIMLCIEEDQATKLMAMMTEYEIKELSMAMSSLGFVRTEVVERTIFEFNSKIANAVSFVGNVDTTQRLLEKILTKEKVNQLMEEIRGPAGKTTWDKLGNVNEELLSAYLKNEYPQTAALILSKLSPAHAARVLALLPDEFAIETILRMLGMGAVKKEILDTVEKTLKSEFISTLTKTQRRDSNELIAEIFNNLDRVNEAKFMGMLEERVPESAEKIKSLMFTFDDLVKINTQGIQAVLRAVDKSKLSVALKGASEPIRKLFLDNMSQRAAKILMDDIEAMGPVRLKDVDEAQSAIVIVAKDLASKGEINISDGGSEDEFIY